MAGEDEELARMLDAWRKDIDSVPFPAFDVDTLAIPEQRRPERPRGWRGRYRVIRAGRGAKAR
jgi:hypothetical protein